MIRCKANRPEPSKGIPTYKSYVVSTVLTTMQCKNILWYSQNLNT